MLFRSVYVLVSLVPSGVLLLLKIYLLFAKSIPLSLSVNVTIAVIISPTFAVVGLKLMVAVCGVLSSITLTLASLPLLVPSHNLAYTVSPWCKPVTVAVVPAVTQFPSVLLFV